jgi:hypothetical protein
MGEETNPLEVEILKLAWDGARLPDLRYELPDRTPDELVSAITRLLSRGLVDMVDVMGDGGAVPPGETAAYLHDARQWLPIPENPWPERGPWYEVETSQSGREFLNRFLSQ